MSMLHYYEFFDREIFDSVWALSWRDYQRKYGSRWTKNMRYEPGEYCGRSLRELICFCVEPETSSEMLEDILARRTSRWTIQHSSPQFDFLTEFMCRVPRCSA